MEVRFLSALYVKYTVRMQGFYYLHDVLGLCRFYKLELNTVVNCNAKLNILGSLKF